MTDSLTGKRVQYRVAGGGIVEINIVKDSTGCWAWTKRARVDKGRIRAVQVPLFNGVAWEPYEWRGK